MAVLVRIALPPLKAPPHSGQVSVVDAVFSVLDCSVRVIQFALEVVVLVAIVFAPSPPMRPQTTGGNPLDMCLGRDSTQCTSRLVSRQFRRDAFSTQILYYLGSDVTFIPE
jgi:hypothetical protein